MATDLPTELVDELVIGGGQVELADEAVGHRMISQLARQQLSVEPVELLTTVEVDHGRDRPRNREGDDRLPTRTLSMRRLQLRFDFHSTRVRLLIKRH